MYRNFLKFIVFIPENETVVWDITAILFKDELSNIYDSASWLW